MLTLSLVVVLCVAGATGAESGGEAVANKESLGPEVGEVVEASGEEGGLASKGEAEVKPKVTTGETTADSAPVVKGDDGTGEAVEKAAESKDDAEGGGDPTGAEEGGADESTPDGVEAEIADERGYFNGLDADEDGAVSMKEFDQHMKNVKAEMEADEDDSADASGPGKLGRAVGMEWLELHEGDSHEHAFAGVDTNRDGKISWKEWVAELFHELPQRPEYRDGELGPVLDESMFKRYDKDSDGFLGQSEIDAFVGKYMRREEVDEIYAGNHEEEVPKENGNTGFTYVFLFEFDANFDGKVSQQEWSDGFAKEAVGPPPGSILLQ